MADELHANPGADALAQELGRAARAAIGQLPPGAPAGPDCATPGAGPAPAGSAGNPAGGTGGGAAFLECLVSIVDDTFSAQIQAAGHRAGLLTEQAQDIAHCARMSDGERSGIVRSGDAVLRKYAVNLENTPEAALLIFVGSYAMRVRSTLRDLSQLLRENAERQKATDAAKN